MEPEIEHACLKNAHVWGIAIRSPRGIGIFGGLNNTSYPSENELALLPQAHKPFFFSGELKFELGKMTDI